MLYSIQGGTNKMADNLKDLEAMHVALREFRTISQANRTTLIGLLTKEHELLGDSVDVALDDPYKQIRLDYYTAGGRRTSANFIQAIKRVREVNKIGLKEAKDMVESWG
jgi:hypothetical protein